VGGTVGDIESMVFLEALRQLQFVVSPENLFFIHVSLVPVLGAVGEQKTKPTQHSVKELRAAGISPDVIVCRSSTLLDESTKNKLSSFCQVPPGSVLSVHDVSNIYHVPLILVEQGLHRIIRKHLSLEGMTLSLESCFISFLPHFISLLLFLVAAEIMSVDPDFNAWRSMALTCDIIDGPSSNCKEVNIALVGKYNGLQDSYLSVIKSLKHSAILLKLKLNIHWVDSSELQEDSKIVRGEESDAATQERVDKYEAAWKVIELAGQCVAIVWCACAGVKSPNLKRQRILQR
jgi:CTP synthase